MVMGFRFRRRIRLFPGITLNLSKNGLSSISLGRPGATVNVPINRTGKTRGTVGLPGTGLSYSGELDQAETETSKGFQPAQPVVGDVLEAAIAMQRDCWLGPTGLGILFWEEHGMGLVKYIQEKLDTPAEIRDACEVVKNYDRVELMLRRCPDAESIFQMNDAIVKAARLIHEYGKEKGICQEDS